MGIPVIHTDLPSSFELQQQQQQSDLQTLLNHRTYLEAELDRFGATLDANHVSMSTPLVSQDGYPRSDIDVANVRIARTAIIRLKNDYKALEKQIETAVHEAFKNGTPLKIQRETGGLSARQNASAAQEAAFCIVNSIAENSPAQIAGLLKDDKVVKFGQTTITNHDKLQGLAREVQTAVNESRPISVTIVRVQNGGNVILVKDLLPSTNWGGRGAVGAHFLPL